MTDAPPVRKRRLRNFLLDPGFQLKYAALIALTGGLLFGVMGGLFYAQVRVNTEIAALDRIGGRAAPTTDPTPEARPEAPTPEPTGVKIESETIEVVGQETPPPAEPSAAGDQGAFEAELEQRLAEGDSRLLWRLVICWLVLVVMLFLLGILVTHRIVGPLYVVDRYLGRIIAGEPMHFRPLRKGDEFQDLFVRVQELAGQLDGERAHDVSTIEAALIAIRQQARGVDPEALAVALAPLEALAEERGIDLVGPAEG